MVFNFSKKSKDSKFYMEYYDANNGTDFKVSTINYCCNKLKKHLNTGCHNYNSDKEYIHKKDDLIIKIPISRRAHYKKYKTIFSLFYCSDIKDKANYCPFCGARIETKSIGKIEYKKVSCEEKVIPAKTEKICKYDWQVVK